MTREEMEDRRHVRRLIWGTVGLALFVGLAWLPQAVVAWTR